jgi:hypothetical protein
MDLSPKMGLSDLTPYDCGDGKRQWEAAMFIKQRIAIVEWAEDHENLFDDRAVIVLALYFLGAIIFGVAAWKSVVIGAAAYGLVLMRIGPRPIAVLGVLFFLAALTGCSGFGDIRQCFKG